MGRELLYAIPQDLVPLCRAEPLYKTRKTACLEMADPAM